MSDLSRLREVYERRARDARGKYSLARPGERFMASERARALREAWRSLGHESLAGLRVLEIGCGRGDRIAELVEWGARAEDLAGVDLMPEFVAEAKANYPGIDFSAGDASRLPFAGSSFDAVMQFTVFSSIRDAALRRAVAAEMLRVLRPGGVVLWYDMRYPNPWNPEVAPIGAAELRALFPGVEFRRRSLTLLPPLARALAPLSFALCRALQALPPLRSHTLAVGRKPR